MTKDLLGYDEDGLPIWAMFGAEGEADDEGGEDDADDTDAEDDDTEDEGDTDDAKKPERKQPKSAKAAPKSTSSKENAYRPPSQAEWNRTQAALKKANDEQRAARKAALEKARKEGQDEAASSAREEAKVDSEATWKPRVVQAEAKAELVAMGCKNPSRLIKLIDRDKVTIQEDGSMLGLEAQLNELKDEWPELFRTEDEATKVKGKKEAPPAKKVGAAAGSSKKDEGEEKKATGAALVAARLLGTSA